jgi:hypothetical protein
MTGASCAGPREQRELRLGRRVFGPEQLLVMAIVNRTPDSFYRPGVTWDPAAALDRVHAVVAEGADIVDIGGVPARPGGARRHPGTWTRGPRASTRRWSARSGPGISTRRSGWTRRWRTT